jgi:hypothetical protein
MYFLCPFLYDAEKVKFHGIKFDVEIYCHAIYRKCGSLAGILT